MIVVSEQPTRFDYYTPHSPWKSGAGGLIAATLHLLETDRVRRSLPTLTLRFLKIAQQKRILAASGSWVFQKIEGAVLVVLGEGSMGFCGGVIPCR